MKKGLLLCFLLLATHFLQAQRWKDSISLLSKQEQSNYYQQKAKGQRVGAIVLLSGGILLGVLGVGVGMSDFNYNLSTIGSTSRATKNNGGLVIFSVGLGCVVGSIPLLISSYQNKRRAKILLQNQATFLTPTFRIQQTAVGISLPLGR